MTCPAHALALHNNLLELDDVDLIMDLVRPLPSGSLVVELGAGVGTTALAVFCANPGVRLVSVDRDWTSLEHARTVCRQLRGIGLEGDADCANALDWVGIESTAATAAALFANESVDMLLEDTWHHYETTLAEMLAWIPKVKRGAPVWVHDYAARSPGFEGVAKAVDELVGTGLLVPGELRGISWSGKRMGRQGAKKA